MNHRGFTIAELLVVIAVMGILLILGVVNLRGTQVNARDSERQTDVDNIALHLETYYQSGSDTVAASGEYPTTALTANQTSIQQMLRDIDIQSVIAPNVALPTISLVAATNATQTESGIAPQPSISQYVYQPMALSGSTWSLCTLDTQECRKFNIYYQLEGDQTVHMISSKNQ